MPQYTDNDVRQQLIQFGISDPTEAEIHIFSGMDTGYGAMQAISEYANTMEKEQERQRNDPLKAFQDMATEFSKDQINQSKVLQTQLQDLSASAPKLFGSLTPDQVQEYLKPLQQSFKEASAVTETAAARTGTAGSSLSAQAQSQQQEKFQENVLSTGLSVGMTEKQNQEQIMAQRIAQLYGGGASALGLVGNAAGQRSAQDLSQSNLIASLPYFLRQSALNEEQAKKTQEKANSGGFLKKFYDVTGAINQGMNTFQNLAMVPQQFKSQGGSPGGSPAFPQGSPSSSEPLGPTGSPMGSLSLFESGPLPLPVG